MARPKKAGGSGKGPTPRKAASTRNEDVARLTRELLEFTNYNRVPSYLPIRNNSRRIVGYQNAATGEVVSVKYYKALENAFTTNEQNVKYGTPGSRQQFSATEITRAEAFQSVVFNRRKRARVRGQSIAESYQLKQAAEGRELTNEEVTKDPYFQGLRDELESFTAQQRAFTNENYEQQILGSPLDPGNVPNRKDIIAAQAQEYRDLLGSNPRYQEVLVELGRRLPDDTRPVGSYKSGEYKLVVQPLYDQAANFPGESESDY